MTPQKNTVDLSGKHPEEITWTAPEFEYTSKNVGWYWLTLIVAALIFLVSVWQKNFLFAIFVIIAEVMVLYWAQQYPRNITFTINKDGIKIGTLEMHPYKELIGFHLKEELVQGYNELILKTSQKLRPYVRIFVFPKDAAFIKKYLLQHAHEIEYEETLSDGLSRMIGF